MAAVKSTDGSISPSRKDRAAATRRRMLDAAYHVFSERGYAKTTMEAVAAAAGVAVQTVYFTFHTKAALLQAAYEYAVLGPEQTPPHLTAWWRAAESAPDIVSAVVHIVDGTVVLFERAAPLVWAVHGDEDARPAYEFNENLRRDGYGQLVDMLAKKHRLRRGLMPRTARDILLTLLGPHVFFVFTTELGWSTQQYATWVKGALLRELFDLSSEDA
jgi:AcrR family transcriptional regulator